VSHRNRSIAELDRLVTELPEETRTLFHRIFSVTFTSGVCQPTEAMLPWIERQFGSVEAVCQQRVIKVTNLITFEGAIFNPLRALRPRQYEDRLKVEAALFDRAKDDPLSNPLRNTPEDPFGRIQGKYCITASNIAKYDEFHGLIVFNDYNPLAFTREKVMDYLDTAWRWAQRAHQYDPSAKYFFFVWNSLKKAGASLAHGHAQVVLGRGSHYAKIEALRRAALDYRQRYGSNYFDDLFEVHHKLELGMARDGIKTFVYLAPIKEKETIILAPSLTDGTFQDQVYEVLACFRDRMHVTAFNVGIATPPLSTTPESWEGLPVIARIVDRGYPWDGSSDFGTMELFAASVISSDPFQVARELRRAAVAAG